MSQFDADRSPVAAGAAPRLPVPLLALGCIGLVAGAPAVAAQEAGERRLGGMTVTDTAIDETYNRTERASEKSTAPLLDTPQTITVISRELIRDRAARTLADVLRNTPGISFEAGENGFGTSSNNFTLRGFDTSGSVFVDNARDSGSYTRDVFNVEAVEVIKGPAADNGRGSAGGYINISTKRPTLERFVSGDIAYGFDQYDSKSRKRGSVDINQPLGDTVAVRLNAVVEDSGIPGRELARNKFWGVAPSIGVGLGTSLRAYLSWERLDRDDRPDWGVPGATVAEKTGYAASATYNPATAGARRDAFYGLRSDFDDSVSDAVLGRIEYDALPGLTLSNQTRWARVRRTARSTAPTGYTAATQTVTAQTWLYDRTNESFSNISNAAASFDTGGVRHAVSAGVELTREKSNAGRFPSIAGPALGTNLFNPDPDRAGPADRVAQQRARTSINTFALYLYDTISFGEMFEITGGVRGEAFDVELTDTRLTGSPAPFRQSRFLWNGKVGATFKPVENGSLYASFGTSALPPGSFLSNPDISREGDNVFPGFVAGAAPIRMRNYEVGAKWDFFGGALSTTAALFRTEKRNVPVVGRDVAAGDPAGSNLLRGYHKQIVEGVELSVSGQITPAWNIFAGALLMDSKRRISPYLNDVRRNGVSGAGDYGAIASVNGDRLAFTPNVSATLWTQYALPFGLTIGAGVQHSGSRYLGRPDDALRFIPNRAIGKLPSFTIANALLSYAVTDNINVRLNVDNIFNEDYASTTNWNGSRATLGMPRTYLLSAGFRF